VQNVEEANHSQRVEEELHKVNLSLIFPVFSPKAHCFAFMLLQQQHWPSSRLWAGFVLLFLLASAFVGSSRSIKDSDTDDNSVRLRREENLIDHTPWTRVLQTYTSPGKDGLKRREE